MEKKITINGKDIALKSSLFTVIDYQNQFGSDLFADMTSLTKLGNNEKNTTKFISVILQVLFILGRESFGCSYDKFLQDLPMEFLTDVDKLEEIIKIIGELLGSAKTPK